MQTVVVLQAYGAAVNLNQNIFCLLSLLRRQEQRSPLTKVAIYTDQPDRFRQFFGADARLQYFDLSQHRVTEWRGAIDFVHRVKVEMLRDAAKHFAAARLFYVDGDTLFLSDPTPLFEIIDDKTSLMHEKENVIELGRDPISKKLTRFLRQEKFNIDGVERTIPTSLAMWNAGVLGFAPSFFARIENVLQFTDELYGRYPKHVMEQLAFSYFLQIDSRVEAADQYVLHYWRQKDAYNELIARFLAENDSVAKAIAAFDRIQFPPPPVPRRSGLQKIGDFISRVMN